MPSRSGFQLAREKKAWARSWDQVRVNPAPVSMPVTVPRPVCAIRPVTNAAKVVKVGAVKQPRRNVSTASSEAGTVTSGSIGGSLTAGDTKHRRCFSAAPLRAARSGPHHPPERPHDHQRKRRKSRVIIAARFMPTRPGQPTDQEIRIVQQAWAAASTNAAA